MVLLHPDILLSSSAPNICSAATEIFTIKLQFAMVRYLKFFNIKHCSNLDHTIGTIKQSQPSNWTTTTPQIKNTFNDMDANYRMHKSWDANYVTTTGSGNHGKQK
jgi:hypothetical protein